MLVSPDIQKGVEATNENIDEIVNVEDSNISNNLYDIPDSSINVHLDNGCLVDRSEESEDVCMSSDNEFKQKLNIGSDVVEGISSNEEFVPGKVHTV